MRALATVITFGATLLATALAVSFAVLILAGPHGGLLPRWSEKIVLAIGWLAVFVLPSLVALKVWRRYGRR